MHLGCVQAIEQSSCVTDDIDTASVVYVYDYCYYVWWLAHVHSRGREHMRTPGDFMMKVACLSPKD